MGTEKITPPTEAAPLATPPTAGSASPFSVRALFVWNDVRGRFPFAFRSALCFAIPMLIGWALGFEREGLIATLGSFTGLYGAQHPYHRRALILAWAATGLTLGVALGALGAVTPWFGMLTVSIFASVAVLLCNSLNVGAPGAYIMVLACTMGTMIHGAPTPLWQILLLVAGGGAISWCVQMFGYLFVPNSPKRRIVVAEARAVRSLARAMGTSGEDAARHFAANALQTALEMLTGTSRHSPYQKLSRRIGMLFAATARRDSPSERLLALSDALVAEAERLPMRRTTIKSAPSEQDTNANDETQMMQIHWRTSDFIKDTFSLPYSEVRRSMIRVLIASIIAGALALSLGMKQPFWAIAAAVLVLHQGGGRKALLARGWLRLIGTLAGLLLAEAIILMHPHGLWLIAIIVLLQFAVEMLVVRNYALGVLFITPGSLLIAANVIGSYDHLLFARGVDTLIGVIVAYVILFTVATQSGRRRLSEAIHETLDACDQSLNLLAAGNIGSLKTQRAQEKLRRRLLDLYNTYNDTAHESRHIEKAILPYWNNVVRVLRLGYQVLLANWNAQEGASLEFDELREHVKIERERCQHMADADFHQEVHSVRQRIGTVD